MNQVIDRLKRIDESISKLDDIKQCGDLIAAGLTISISLGPDDTETKKRVCVEVSSNLVEILDAVKAGLIDSKKINTIFAKQELTEINEYLKG